MRKHQHAVLIVDDEGETRDAIRAHLEAIGLEVVCARHGRAALQLLSLGITPCAMVVDVVKPGVAGAELRRALQYDTALRDIPVVAITEGPAPRSLALASDLVRETVDVACAAADGYCPFDAGLRRDATPRGLGPAFARPSSRRGTGRRYRAAAFESSR